MTCENRNPENNDSNNKEESGSGRFGSPQKEMANQDRQDFVKTHFCHQHVQVV